MQIDIKSIALAINVAAFAFLPGKAEQTTKSPLVGVWRVVEVRSDKGPNTSPQPGLFLFTHKHYSIVQVVGNAPRPRPSQNPTVDELLAIYGPSFNANAGEYVLKGDGTTLITFPLVAKNPGAMIPNAALEYNFSMEGPELLLTTAPRGGATLSARGQTGGQVGQSETTYRLRRLE